MYHAVEHLQFLNNSVRIAPTLNVDPINILSDTKEEGIFSRSIYYSLAQIFRRNYHTLCFICIALIWTINTLFSFSLFSKEKLWMSTSL